jgi:hypothetical protein
MMVANFTTVNSNMGNTRLYEDFSKFLGEKSPVIPFPESQG